MFEEITINESEAIALLNQEESHFFDATRKQGDGRTLLKKAVAFANADGGEVHVGIIDKHDIKIPSGIFGRWDGFTEQEEANTMIQNLVSITPSIDNLYFDYYLIKEHPELGKVLKVTIQKSSNVHYTPDKKVYVRKGAQCLEITGEAILNLRLSKGVISYENQSIENYYLGDIRK
jgi:ATP-dependent DNA helicase RecG